MRRNTIIFIHGMFQNPKSWDKWITYFTERGYHCKAPAWPAHEGLPADLRAYPSDALGKLTLAQVIDAMEIAVRDAGANKDTLPHNPIIIGHSVGGLIAQILVNRHLASMAVPICPVAPNMMTTLDWPFFKNVTTIANPLKGDEPVYQTVESFHTDFCNTLGETAARKAFETYATHDSRNVLRGCLGAHGHVDLDRPHVPLLFIGAKEDRIIPTELVEKNSKAYSHEEGHVSYREFPNRSHYICGEPGWEEVAAHVHQWLEIQAKRESGVS